MSTPGARLARDNVHQGFTGDMVAYSFDQKRKRELSTKNADDAALRENSTDEHSLEQRFLRWRPLDPDAFGNSRWCHDTPGLESPDQSARFLDAAELRSLLEARPTRVEVLPRAEFRAPFDARGPPSEAATSSSASSDPAARDPTAQPQQSSDQQRQRQRVLSAWYPRTYVAHPGTTLFISGLARLDFLAVSCYSSHIQSKFQPHQLISSLECDYLMFILIYRAICLFSSRYSVLLRSSL